MNTQLRGCWESKELSGNFRLLYAKFSDSADKEQGKELKLSCQRDKDPAICHEVNVVKDITSHPTFIISNTGIICFVGFLGGICQQDNIYKGASIVPSR